MLGMEKKKLRMAIMTMLLLMMMIIGEYLRSGKVEWMKVFAN